MDVKLGKLPARDDSRTLRIANYLRPEALPPAPSKLDLTTKVASWGMLGNDRWGDCAEAYVGHQVIDWAALVGRSVSVDEASVLRLYSAVTGFDPNKPSTDQGTVYLDLLKYWRNAGFTDAAGTVHKIAGFAAVTPTDHVQVKTALDLFEGVALGIALPLSAQDQVGSVWKCTTGAGSAAGSWGGHAVPLLRYDRYHAWVVTWGQVQECTWGFINRYADEAYTCFSTESIDAATQRTPEGFDAAQLQADLGQFPVAA